MTSIAGEAPLGNYSPMDWLPHSAWRSPAWRALRAAHRHGRGLPADPSLDDAWVEAALGALAGGGPRDPAGPLAAARAVHEGGGLLRWALEAQLLTARTFAEVARACALPEAAVGAYHRLYFDVRSRPAATDWLLTMAVKSSPPNGFAGPQPGGLWKYAAFAGGGHVLDAVASATLPAAAPAWLARAFPPAPGAAGRRLRLKAKLLVAALTAPEERLGAVLGAWEQLRAAGAGGESPGGSAITQAAALFELIGRSGPSGRTPNAGKSEPGSTRIAPPATTETPARPAPRRRPPR